MKDSKEAFLWIVNILREHGVPFRISGGMAANVYGSSRELADIDIDIPEEKFNEILPDVKEFVIDEPERFVGNSWDLMLMTLNYYGQDIDICGNNVKIQDAKTGQWIEQNVNFSESESHDIFGASVPVINKDRLIAYKTILRRPVDIQDIAEISKRLL